MARPTDTSIQATGLSSPDLGATSFVQAAPVDTSGIVAGQGEAAALGMQAAGIHSDAASIQSLSRVIPGIVEAGLEAHKGLATKAMHEELNAEIDATRIAHENPELAMATVGGIDLAKQSLWNKMDGKSSQDITAVEANFAKEAKVLQQAFTQGAMDASGLRMRLLNITRKHINNNPGLANQLLAHSEKVLAISGVSSLRDVRQKLDDSAAKAFEKQRDFLKKEASKHNVDFDVMDLDTPEKLGELQEKVNSKKRHISAFKNFEEEDKVREIGNKKDADAFAKKHLPTLLRGGVDAFHIDAQAILKSLEQNPEQIPNAIGALAQEYIDGVNEKIAPLANMSSPEAKMGYDRFVESIKSASDRVMKASKGENLLEALTNQNKIDAAKNEAGLRNEFNMEAVDFAAKNEIVNRWIMRHPDTIDRILKTTSAMVFARPDDPHLIKTMKSRTSNNPNTNDAVAIAQGYLEAGDRPGFSQALKVYSDATKTGKLDQQEIFNFLDNFVEEFSNPSTGALARKTADKGDIIQLGELTGQYVNFVGNAIRNKMQGGNVQVNEIEGVGVNFKAPGNLKLERELNHIYASKINKLTKVFMNVGGLSHGEAWGMIRNSHGNAFGLQSSTAGKPNASNPGNLKVPGKNEFQSFANPEEGIRAVAKQISLYATGQSKNVNNPTPIPKDFLKIYNNQNEKGSATDSAYASNVSKFSGIDLSQPLDEADMVDLIYGIVKAENTNSPLTRKDVRAALAGGM